MATVYLAGVGDGPLARICAVKLLRAGLPDHDYRTRFLDEARLRQLHLVVCLNPLEEVAQLSPGYHKAIAEGRLPFRWQHLPMRDFGLGADPQVFRQGVEQIAHSLVLGEQVLLHEPKLNRRIRPLAQALASEPLLTRFATPLPSLPQLTDLSKQQVRGILAGRNQRLRRELFWKRPPRKPLQLPALLAVPGSVEIRYYYPE